MEMAADDIYFWVDRLNEINEAENKALKQTKGG